MPLARVVTFDDVPQDRVDAMRSEMSSGGRPEGMPATEIMLLYDGEAERAVAIVFFDDEDDYHAGDAFLNAMPAGDTPGRRTSVAKYEVAVRMTA
jgi:hypothetical protein